MTLELPGIGGDGHRGDALRWADVLTPTTAEIVGRYEGEYFAGEPAVALNRYGSGRALYVGTIGDRRLHDAIVEWMVESAAVFATAATPDGVEAVTRWSDSQEFLFLLNHSAQRRTVDIQGGAMELLSGGPVSSDLTLEPYGVAVLRMGQLQ